MEIFFEMTQLHNWSLQTILAVKFPIQNISVVHSQEITKRLCLAFETLGVTA
jgi:hypothetical protein